MLPLWAFAFASVCASLYFRSTNAQIFDPIHFGAIGDGKMDDTAAIRAAVAAAAKNHGGMVLFDTHYTFLTGCFELTTSNIILNVKGTILASQNYSDYVQDGDIMYRAVVQSVKKSSNITITGGGTIDGQGAPWWVCGCGDIQLPPCSGTHYRPRLLQINDGIDVHVYNIKFKNAAAWTTSFNDCSNLHIDNVHITAPPSAGPGQISHNTDGFDISKCSNVLLENTYYSGGDDAVALGGGNENILIRNLTIGTSHGLSIGSHTDGGVRNVTFQDITCNGSDAGVKIKTQRGHGGTIQDITYTNIRLYNVRIAIWFTFTYTENVPPTSDIDTPHMKNINVNNIFSDGAKIGWSLDGLPESVITDVVFSNITFVNTSTLIQQCNYIIATCDNVTPSCPPCLQ